MLKDEMRAFDSLPKNLRDKLNSCSLCIDPLYVQDRYRVWGERATIEYLDNVLPFICGEQMSGDSSDKTRSS